MEMTDKSLWESWRLHRDANAFTELLTRHSGMVYATCKRVLSNEGDAEDAAQECFVQLMDARITVKHSLAPWLHTVATRRALDMAKARGRRARRNLQYAVSSPSEDGAKRDDLMALLDEIVEGLTDDHRILIVERFFRGRKLSDLAEEFKISESTVRYRIEKGVEEVRAQLKRYGISTVASSLTLVLSTQIAEAAPATLVTQLGKMSLVGGQQVAVSSALIGGTSAITKTSIAIVVLIAALLSTRALLNRSEDIQPPEVQLAGSEDVAINTPEEAVHEEEAASDVVAEPLEETTATPIADVVEPGFGRISGRVVSSLDRKPLNEFKVLVVNGEYSPEMAAMFQFHYPPEGDFIARGASPEGPVSLRVRAPGYREAVVPVAGVRAGATRTNVVVSMEPESILDGNVVDRWGRPVDGAIVYKGLGPASVVGDSLTGRSQEETNVIVTGDSNVIATSDSNGSFLVGGLLQGEQKFTVHQPGYSPTTASAYIAMGNNSIRLVLGDGGTLEGTILLSEPAVYRYSMLMGEIFSDAGIRRDLFEFSGKCNEDGSFRITGIPEGRGYLRVIVPYSGTPPGLLNEFLIEIEIIEGMTTAVNLALGERDSSIQGYILTDQSESTNSQIHCQVDTGDHVESYSTKIGEDGFYRLAPLPSGTVSIRWMGWFGKWTTTVLSANEDLILDLDSDGGATLRSYVANQPSMKDIRAYLVHESITIPDQMDRARWSLLSRLASSPVPVEGGVATLSGIENGSYTLVVTAIPYEGSQQADDRFPLEVATAPVVIQNETDVDVDISF